MLPDCIIPTYKLFYKYFFITSEAVLLFFFCLTYDRSISVLYKKHKNIQNNNSF